jgi:hypothetical protein
MKECLDSGLLAITNEPMELGMFNFVWKYHIVSMTTIFHVLTVKSIIFHHPAA